MISFIWFAVLCPLADAIDHKVNRFQKVKNRTFADTQKEFGMASADEYYTTGMQLPDSY